MSNILKIPFDKIREEGNFTELFETLERSFRKFDIDYYLVGALARDIWMKGVFDTPSKRATKDIDFGILVKNNGTFDQLREYLIKNEGFHSYKENAFKLAWKDKTQIDLIPFGDLEKNGEVTVSNGRGFTSMNVEGFKEVFNKATIDVEIDNKNQFKVCTLPGIVVLKLIAWDDRSEMRSNDIRDISEILIHYFNFNDEIIWEKHSDLFPEKETDLMLIAARFMGREISKIVNTNDKLKLRITGVLKDGCSSSKSWNKLDELLAKHLKKDIDFCSKLLISILQGIND